MTDSPTCPKCHRPFNEGNSPNAAECNGTDDDEGVCEAYAKVATLRAALEVVRHVLVAQRVSRASVHDHYVLMAQRLLDEHVNPALETTS